MKHQQFITLDLWRLSVIGELTHRHPDDARTMAERLAAHAEKAWERQDGSMCQVLMRFGVPQQFYSDNGAAYRSRILHQVGARLGIATPHTPARQPQGRGRIERPDEQKSLASLKNSLRKYRDVSLQFNKNQASAQKDWLERNPSYWEEYRKRNPESAERNRIKQCERNRQARNVLPKIAKMDELDQPNESLSGLSDLVLVYGQMIAKMDEQPPKAFQNVLSGLAALIAKRGLAGLFRLKRYLCFMINHIEELPLFDLGNTFGTLRCICPKAETAQESSLELHGQLSLLVYLLTASELEVIDDFKRLHVVQRLAWPTVRIACLSPLPGKPASIRIASIIGMVSLNRLPRSITALEEAMILEILSRAEGLSAMVIASLAESSFCNTSSVEVVP